jgi:hypothetical protein
MTAIIIMPTGIAMALERAERSSRPVRAVDIQEVNTEFILKSFPNASGI